MKIVVTELPKEPKDCLFSQLDLRTKRYVCILRTYIPEADERDIGYKPKCLCNSCAYCQCLEVQNGL